MQLKPFENSAYSMSQAVRSGELKLPDILNFYLERTRSYEKNLNCFLSFEEKYIEQQADQLQKRLATGESLPLAGIPVAVKDNICVAQQPNTCGSKILENFKPLYNATAVEKLIDAGAIIFAKTNCDEFAMGSSNENSAYGAVKNPWNPDYVPGGSSGGSAACVAADLVPLSLGSDTGGSIRQPASFCGVVGVKPTYGSVSRSGLVAFGSSLDQIGPMAQNVMDAAVLLDIISGFDPKDSTSRKFSKPSYSDSLAQFAKQPDLKGMKIGIIKELNSDGLSTDVQNTMHQASQVLADQGAELVEVSLPYLEYAVATYYVIATAEASANLARFDGVRYGYRSKNSKTLKDLYINSRSEAFGREVKQRIMLGTYVLSSGYYDAYYEKATRVREMLRRDFQKAFEQVDLLFSPVSPVSPFKLGEKVNDPLSMYLSDICTIGVNLAGTPAISVPAGYSSEGLPIGLQLMGGMNQEKKMLKGALAYEQSTKWWQQRRPNLR